MKRPSCILSDREVDDVRRAGSLELYKVCRYMRLESGELLELRRSITIPIYARGLDPYSDDAKNAFILENMCARSTINSLEQFDGLHRLENLHAYRFGSRVAFEPDYSGRKFEEWAGAEWIDLTKRDAENLREALRYLRLEFLERLEARYAKNPRECIV